MLAATCVHNGRLPRQYAPIYERFREVVAQALDLGRGVDPKRGATVADSLEWRESVDLAQRWLQAMESTGDPKGVMAILREKMTPWRALQDPSLQQSINFALQAAGLAAVAYLDGVRALGEELVMILTAAHELPFAYDSPAKYVQWDVFSSASCWLSASDDNDLQAAARVAVVPRLWASTLSESDRSLRDGRYIMLASEVRHSYRAEELCTAVADAISRSGDARLLSSHQYPTVSARLDGERKAREVAASLLNRRLW